jgi:hypothetical protein
MMGSGMPSSQSKSPRPKPIACPPVFVCPTKNADQTSLFHILKRRPSTFTKTVLKRLRPIAWLPKQYTMRAFITVVRQAVKELQREQLRSDIREGRASTRCPCGGLDRSASYRMRGQVARIEVSPFALALRRVLAAFCQRVEPLYLDAGRHRTPHSVIKRSSSRGGQELLLRDHACRHGRPIRLPRRAPVFRLWNLRRRSDIRRIGARA